MNKKELIAAAETLSQPNAAAAGEFENLRGSLTGRVMERMRQRTDLEKLIGDGNEAMLADNAANMARFMASMFQQYDPVIFVETIHWVFRTYRAHGFNLAFWPAFLNTWMEEITALLAPDTVEQLNPFYRWIQIKIPIFTMITDQPETT